MNWTNKTSNFLFILAITLYGEVVLSQEITNKNVFTGQSVTESMMSNFVENYMGIDQLGTYLISLFVAIGLAMIIAFHPQTFGKKEDINEIEAPKTLIFYAMIGSLIGATVADYGAELGFIFFGLGGLMRFRTNTGTSVQTGRLILVALIGLCCGLKMIYIAIVSTIVGWILIYFLERKTLYQIEIKGINSEMFLKSVESFRQVLQQQKCKIIIEKKNQAKSRVSFIFSSVSNLDRDALEQLINQQLAETDPVSIDWNVGYKK